MSKIFVTIMVLMSLLSFPGCKNNTGPSDWSSQKIDEWFEAGEWQNGWLIKPDSSINKKEFAISYFKNKERWDMAFKFLKTSNLSKLEPRRYNLDSDNLYASVSQYITKNKEDARFEAHQKYIDIQYIINGAEQMSVAPLLMKKDILVPYDSEKDLEFMTVTNFTSMNATPANFFIFFPSDLHRPSVKIGENSQVKKVVVKVKVN
jgi:YhcH/YjgK/YiaL family protein